MHHCLTHSTLIYVCAQYYDWKLTFCPRKRLLVERTVKLSPGEPSVVLSADAALLTSPGFCWRPTTLRHFVTLAQWSWSEASQSETPADFLLEPTHTHSNWAAPWLFLLPFSHSSSWPLFSWLLWASSREPARREFPVSPSLPSSWPAALGGCWAGLRQLQWSHLSGATRGDHRQDRQDPDCRL